MSDQTVQELACLFKISTERLLQQMKKAGITVHAATDTIDQDKKMALLGYLRKSHGKNATSTASVATQVTLKRRSVTSLKQGTVHGKETKTINIQVNKKKTYIKRDSVKKMTQERTQKQVAEEQSHREKASKEKVPLEVQQASTIKLEEARTEQTQTEKQVDRHQQEKATHLKVSVERNAEKVRKQAVAKKIAEEKKATKEDTKKPTTVTKPTKKVTTVHRRADKPSANRKLSYAKKRRKKSEQQLPIDSNTKHIFEKPTAIIAKNISIPENIIVSELAQRISVKAAEVIKNLMKLGVMSTINQSIDQETATILVEEMGHHPIMTNEEDHETDMLAEHTETDERDEFIRAPIVTIMGHVDHGKTSLLDYIRKTRVASGEAGGITQHIGAYQVKTDHGAVTFLDTPGHAAFTAMRARGANITDIVIVVVAADDGVMPQTKEAIEHARVANVPIIIAINKIDKPNINPDKVMQELSAIDVIPEEWGGDVQFIKISAQTGEGINDLIESLILQAELLELKAPNIGTASGLVIETRLDKGRGVVVTMMVQKGMLEQGQIVLCGHEYGRVRAMFDENGDAVKIAGPATPVEILGLSGTPNAGDDFVVVTNERAAKDLAEHREDKSKLRRNATQQALKLEEVFSKMAAGETSNLNIIIKTDVQGSLEALRESLNKLATGQVSIKIVYGGVGSINEGDVSLALASAAMLVGFNVRADATARKLALEKEIDLHYYSVIYHVIDEVKKFLSGMLLPEIKEKIVGIAEVRDTFRSPKFGLIAGCMVIDGFVKRNLPIRVLRDNIVIYTGQLESLRHLKDDINEAKMGMECGIGVKNYHDVKIGDQIEVFEHIEVQREL